RRRESILILPAHQQAKWIPACAGMTALRFLALLSVIAAGFVLAGCSPPPVPDVTYFRLPPPAALPHPNKPLTGLPSEADTCCAAGGYSEQALIYTIGDGSAVRTSHYQLWSDPPPHALQARLIAALRAAGISELVTDRLPASTQALRVHGIIRRY